MIVQVQCVECGEYLEAVIAIEIDNQNFVYPTLRVKGCENCMKEMRRRRQLREAIEWALGENGEFRQKPEGAGNYWWRKELRQRAGL